MRDHHVQSANVSAPLWLLTSHSSRGRSQNVLGCPIFNNSGLSGLQRLMRKCLNSNDLRISNKTISSPQKALLLSTFCSLWPVLLVWESKEDDLTLLILVAHQKHIGEGTKCCYYQKPTFEIKLHFIPYPLFDTPRQGAAREFKAPC